MQRANALASALILWNTGGGMIKGSKPALVKKIQPISIHGQISLDLYYADPEDPDGPVAVARVGTEAVPKGIEPGDRVDLHYVLGVVTAVTKS